MACDIITENLIKGIIVTYSRTGVTLQQISNVYYECVGENWSLLKGGEEHAMRYLNQIEGILSIVNEKNETVWYVRGKTLNGEKRGQIFRAKNPRTDFDLSSNPHGNARNTCTQYNGSGKGNANNNNFRNARYVPSSNNDDNNTNGKVNRNPNAFDVDINGNYDPRKQSKYNANNRVRVNGHNSGSSINNVSGGSGSSSSSSMTTEQKTSASMYGYDLVGDDFFMEMAKIDLSCCITNRKNIQRSGFCVSGQRIRDATDRLKQFPNTDNMKIIVNLGTVDILHGRFITDMCQDYINLVKLCAHRGIEVIITTLAPIGNRLHVKDDVKKLNDFNTFLYNKFRNTHQIIDITACMVNPKTGKTFIETTYQPLPKYVTGSNKPHLLWNRIGRQRILNAIKKCLRF